MRWRWPWRRRSRVAAGLGELTTFRPGSWADVALPPAEEPAVRKVVPSPGVPPVRLGFADGTSVDVDESSADSQALRAAVRRLLSG
jgi:hypothetical protein